MLEDDDVIKTITFTVNKVCAQQRIDPGYFEVRGHFDLFTQAMLVRIERFVLEEKREHSRVFPATFWDHVKMEVKKRTKLLPWLNERINYNVVDVTAELVHMYPDFMPREGFGRHSTHLKAYTHDGL
jgi:hypothetical protein